MGFWSTFASGEAAGRGAVAGEAAAERTAKNHAINALASSMSALEAAVDFRNWAHTLENAVSMETKGMVAKNIIIEALTKIPPELWLQVEANRRRISDKVNDLAMEPDIELRANNRYQFAADGQGMLLGPNEPGPDGRYPVGVFKNGQKVDVAGIVKGELGIE